MANYFPRHTVAWKIEEPRAFRRLTLSLVEMAVLTGVALRLFRSLVLTHGQNSWLYLGGTFALGGILLFGMTTAHLGNYTVRHWLWRGPVFGLVEAAAELATAMVLIAVGREPIGTERAEFSDWTRIAGDVLLYRVVPVIVFVAVLAGVVQLVRYTLIKGEDRDHTLEAIHEEIERERAAEATND
jgi:hypothetical protein